MKRRFVAVAIMWGALAACEASGGGDAATGGTSAPGDASVGGGAGGGGGAAGHGGHSGGASGGSGGASGGSGGASGGSGGASGGAGGTGGTTGGTGGSGGVGTEAFFCQELCDDDSDCSADFHCVEQRCFHRQVLLACNADAQCVPQSSAWFTVCDDDAGCPGQACVDVEGAGRCAVIPSEFLTCEQLGMELLDQPRHGADGTVGACTQTRATCRAGQCMVVCREDAHCGGEYPHCDQASGRCQCTAESCQTNASVCEDGVCHCTSDADCSQGAVDTCYGGFCGCSGAAICPAQTSQPGTTWSCEAYHL